MSHKYLELSQFGRVLKKSPRENLFTLHSLKYQFNRINPSDFQYNQFIGVCAIITDAIKQSLTIAVVIGGKNNPKATHRGLKVN